MVRKLGIIRIAGVAVVLAGIIGALAYWQLKPQPRPDIRDLPADSDTIVTNGTVITVSELRSALRASFAYQPQKMKSECKNASKLSFDDAVAYWHIALQEGSSPPLFVNSSERKFAAVIQDECYRYY